MKKRKFISTIKRLAIGATVTIVAFALVVLAVTKLLNWPTSLLTLVGMLALAWVAGILAGERIATPRLCAIVASALAIALASSTITLGIPWKIGSERGWFRYQASFTYLGPSDNQNENSLINLWIRFPFPNVDNVGVPIPSVSWSLYYIENDNVTLVPQIENGMIIGFKGSRTLIPAVTPYGWELAHYGPALSYSIDQLYPREVFVIATEDFEAPEGVTLKVYGISLPLIYYNSKDDISARLMSWARLTKKILDNFYDTVEEFAGISNNASPGFYYPIPNIA